MGDLAGFRYRDVVKVLKHFGFAQCREAKAHIDADRESPVVGRVTRVGVT